MSLDIYTKLGSQFFSKLGDEEEEEETGLADDSDSEDEIDLGDDEDEKEEY